MTMLTLSQSVGLGKLKQRVEVTPELAKIILQQPQTWSTRDIAIACHCSVEEVRAVYDDEKKWREECS